MHSHSRTTSRPVITGDAISRLARTLGGTPLAKRIEQCVEAFAGIQVNASALEKRVGKPRAKWEAQDLASLLTSYQSIQRGEMKVEDEFDLAPRATGDLAAQVTRRTGEIVEEQP